LAADEQGQPKRDGVAGEEAIIQGFLAPLARGFAGALGLRRLRLAHAGPGTELVLKTDPVAEGVHFLPDDAPATSPGRRSPSTSPIWLPKAQSLSVI
jgi:hypothetical protein